MILSGHTDAYVALELCTSIFCHPGGWRLGRGEDGLEGVWKNLTRVRESSVTAVDALLLLNLLGAWRLTF